MKYLKKISFLICVFTLISLTSNSQEFPAQTTKIDNEISTSTSSNELKSNTTNTKVTPNTNIDLNINKQLNTEAVNYSLKKYATKTDGNFLMETLPEDSDIVKKKYWAGKDISFAKLGSNMSLGTFSTNSKVVRVVCRDHSYVDGDIIKIFINEQPLENNVVLNGSGFIVYLDLKKGYNRIDFQALNQGLSGPNTAELMLFDENDNLIAAKEWNLLTGGVATIGVIQQQ